MLLEFTCSNFKSINNKVKLSMLASTDDTREEELIKFEKYRVNRISSIYGANGSGKTNVLDAMAKSSYLIFGSMRMEPGELLSVTPHKLASPETPTEFTFQFVANGVRYAYGFSVLKGKIDEEHLYYFPKNRQMKIFSRKQLNVEGGDSFRKFTDSSLEVLKDNRLFLACAANYTSYKEIENAFLFFKKDLRFFKALNSDSSSTDAAIKYMAEHPELKDTYLKIVEYLGTGIRDIQTKYEESSVSLDELPDNIPKGLKEFLTKGKSVVSEAKVVYDLFSTDLATEESTGIKKLFAFLYPYLDTLQNGRVLVCDEIENGLHESLVMGILKLFSQIYSDKNAQIIFTTHDTSLLNSDLFRRDQIWFTELNHERATDLYSLAEIRNVRKSENLEKGYISGKYRAIPMLNPEVYEEIKKEMG